MQKLGLRSRATLSAVVSAVASLASAAPATSPYSTDPQSSYVEDDTSRGIGEVNTIVCVISALRGDALVNEGNYLALVDKTKCDHDRGVNSGAGSEGTQAASYVNAAVNSSRASNDEPMRVRAWIDLSEKDMNQLIYANIAATEGPTAANPYGVFRLDFCGRADGNPSCAVNGYLQGADSGLTFYESEGTDERVVAMHLATVGTSSGSGRLQMQGDGADAEFTFAYDQSLFRRSDGETDQCFSRDAGDPETKQSVWRYGLYDMVTGERVERDSGFPIEYTHDGHTWHGYLGYYGLSLPPDAQESLHSGSTVEKVDYVEGGEPTRTPYSVLQAGGKLVRYTRHTRSLSEIDSIEFTAFVGSEAEQLFPGATPWTQYVLHWDDSAGAFKVTGFMNCSGNGCQTQALETIQTVSVAFWASRGGVQGWSSALGGEIFVDLHGIGESVDSATVQVVYRSQDLVYPADMPSTLLCVRDCPTSASMGDYFAPASEAQSPFAPGTFNNWNPTPAGSVVAYSMNPATALLVDSNGANVSFTDAEALESNPSYRWGVRSGRLFTNVAQAECAADSGTYCDWRVNDLEVYYQWETGANPWNQFVAVKDASNNFVSFDPPLQVTFDVPDTVAYGQYAGTSIVLQYGGFGELWGIPGYCVSRSTNEPVPSCDENSRYVPMFVIPFDQSVGQVSAGGATYLVKWLNREIRFARKSVAACDAAGLDLPANVALPTSAELENPSSPTSPIYIGERPEVSDAARVIHGDVKF